VQRIPEGDHAETPARGSPLRAARADWDTDRALREDCHLHRPNAERTASQIATQGGQRIKLRYHGTVKNNAWLKYRTAAVNLRNLLGCGLTRLGGTYPRHPSRPPDTPAGHWWLRGDVSDRPGRPRRS
jgi:hypothetical protein